MVRLVLCDMDGTILDRDELLPDTMRSMAARLRSAGIVFTVATGRVDGMADSYVEALGIDAPYILSNGAAIRHGRNTVLRLKIALGPLKPLLDTAMGQGMSVIYSMDGVEYVPAVTEWVEGQRRRFDRYHLVRPFSEADWASLDVDKITVMDSLRDGRIGKIEAMCSQLPPGYSTTRYTDKAVELVREGATKASALRMVCTILDIPLSATLAIGDHRNDMEMIIEAGIGVAVGNAIDDLKNVADYVCMNSFSAGVLEAVEKFCFPSEERVTP